MRTHISTYVKPAVGRRLTLVTLIPFAAITLRLATSTTADASYLVLAGYALLGRAQAIQALALSWLFTMLNPGIGADAQFTTIGRYAVLGGAALSVLMRSRLLGTSSRVQRFTLVTISVGIFFVIHSLFFSPIPDVSILKAVSWTVAMATLLAAWSGLSSEDAFRLEQWLFGALIVVMLVSLPLILLPVGYLRNGTGFQGVLNHPQAFGPVIALLAAWATGWMITQRKPPFLAIALVVVCLVVVVLSETRTAGVAFVFGVTAAAFGAPFIARRSVRRMAPGLQTRWFHALLLLALIGSVAAGSKVTEVVSDYLSKSGRAQFSGLVEAYDVSRGKLIDDMWANIQEQPFRGIGFGIASDPFGMDVSRDPLLGLPVGAAIEKGVMPIAVLEEVGLVGFALVAFWVVLLIRRSALRGIAPLSVCAVALFLNLGEAQLFSPGGNGMIVLILLAWAAAGPMARRETRFRQADA